MTLESKSRKAGWRQNPDAVRADILQTATRVFSEHGLAGTTIDEIVRQTQTSKRMIYYYFRDKNGLYLAVLEAAYARIRAGEDRLDLEILNALEALDRLVDFTFDYHHANPEYVRLVMIENIHRAAHLKPSKAVAGQNLPAIEKLRLICRRGVAEGSFRADLDPVALHWLITSSCIFNVSNRWTFAHLYGDRLFTTDGQSALKTMIMRTIRDAVRR